MLVVASASAGAVTLTSCGMGGGSTNYSLNAELQGPTGFSVSQSGSTLTGGTNPQSGIGIALNLQGTFYAPVTYQITGGGGCGGAFPFCSFTQTTPGAVIPTISNVTPPIYDSGTLSVEINHVTASYTYGPTDNPTTIASGLATQINTINTNNPAGSFITATAPTGSTTIQLTSTVAGIAADWPITTSVTYNTAVFNSASFAATTAPMLGATNGVAGTTSTGPYTQYVYSPSGSKVATLQNGALISAVVPLPGGGSAVYNSSGFNYFRHKDWLGSSRLATTWNHSVYSKEAYSPFGETYNEAGTLDRSFTGQDQAETAGVYDYLFRKYDPVAGRWLSPDPSGWDAVSQDYPQSLDRYAYVQNDPMSLTDPDGLDCVYFHNGGSISEVDPGQCNNPGGTYVNGTITGPITPTYSAATQGMSYSYAYTPYGLSSTAQNGGIFYVTVPLSYGTLVVPNGSGPSAPSNPTTPSVPTPSGPDSSVPIINDDMLKHWPFNGNLWPGFTPQDGVCTTGPLSNRMNSNPAVLACCQAHDACYTNYNCNVSSFIPGGPAGPCKYVCNANVMACIATAH